MRKQHYFFLLSLVLTAILYFLPVWELQLGVANSSETHSFLLFGDHVKLSAPLPTSWMLGVAELDFWYLNTIGLGLFALVTFGAFLHFGELQIQRRWGMMAIAGGLAQFLFLYLEIRHLIRQLNSILNIDLRTLGSATSGDLIIHSLPYWPGLVFGILSLVCILISIFYITKDLKLIESSNRLR